MSSNGAGAILGALAGAALIFATGGAATTGFVAMPAVGGGLTSVATTGISLGALATGAGIGGAAGMFAGGLFGGNKQQQQPTSIMGTPTPVAEDTAKRTQIASRRTSLLSGALDQSDPLNVTRPQNMLGSMPNG